jgi:hypothetical protein
VGSLDRRLRALEGRTPAPPPGGLCEEIWAIDAEIRTLEREMKASGIDPQPTPGEVQAFLERFEGLALDEQIAALEDEIAREEQEHDD